MVREIGKSKKVPIGDLQVGHKLQGDIRGAHEKILMAAGEILTKAHIDFIKKVNAREGAGKLSLYTREVQAVMTNASGDEFPAVHDDPEKSHTLKNWYKRGSGLVVPPHLAGTRIEKGFEDKAKRSAAKVRGKKYG